MNITAIILDLDGVLVDTESVAKKAWFQAAADFDFSFSDELYASMVGRPVAICQALITPFLPKQVGIDQFMERCEFLYLDEMEQNGVKLLPGVLELLDWIEHTKLANAIATSSERVHAHNKLNTAGLGNQFEVVVTCDDVKHGKPAPDLFLLAAQRIGHDINNCMVIDDSEAGVTGAHAAGAIPIMVPNMIKASDQAKRLSYAVISNLYEAIDVMETLLRDAGKPNTKKIHVGHGISPLEG